MTIPVGTIRTRDTGKTRDTSKKEWGSGCGSRALKAGQLAQTFPGQDPSSTPLALLKPGSAPVLSSLGIPSRVSLREFISVPAAKTVSRQPEGFEQPCSGLCGGSQSVRDENESRQRGKKNSCQAGASGAGCPGATAPLLSWSLNKFLCFLKLLQVGFPPCGPKRISRDLP